MRTVHPRRHATGFTLVELLVVIGIIAMLITILLPALNAAREKAKKVQCANNIRTFGQAVMMYANQNKGRVPMHRGGANWLWDMSYDTRDWFVEVAKIPREMFYCPSYTHETQGQWDFTGAPGPGNVEYFMIPGYFWLGKRPGYQAAAGGPFSANTLTNAPFRNPEEDRWIEKITDKTTKSTPSDLVLMSDIVLSKRDDRFTTDQNFINVHGGYFMGHGTTHRSGMKPLGGNNLYLDGHVEWRPFDMMKNRMGASIWPNFWF